ncbi:MAG: ABC transporter permease subunit [Phycisphaerales bacterium]|nr:ABC transporter permease subunit [Phycisphaerales bacterium]
MKREKLLRTLNRIQQSMTFRIAASAVVLAIVLLFDVWRLIDELSFRQFLADPSVSFTPSLAKAFDTVGLVILRDLSLPTVPIGNFVFASLALAALLLLIIWLGQGLTYLLLSLLVGVVAGVVLPFAPAAGRFVIAAAILAMAFAILKAAMRLILSLPWQPLAVARNVLDEAVRMKVSLIFIVFLVIALAFLPNLLDESQPLRYRIQTFLQWGSGGAFVIIAFLTVFLSIATVAFEQRDRQIWQIVSKPVSRGSYLLGKWIGVMGLNAILLVIVGSAVFMFTQYLRTQQPVDDYDRYAVNQLVLTARTGVGPSYDDPVGINLIRLIDAKLEQYELSDAPIVDQQPVDRLREMIAEYDSLWTRGEKSEARSVVRELFRYGLMAKLRTEVIEQLRTRRRTISPSVGGNITGREFLFEGLDRATRLGRSVVLRYKINSGTNEPGAVFNITFEIPTLGLLVQPTALKQTQTLDIPIEAISDDGTLAITVYHGDYRTGWSSVQQSIYFPPDGLELMYTVGTFEGNYVRVMVVHWIKLGLLAAMGVAAATFLSFPVASMFTFVGLFAAESSGFLRESLKYYTTHEREGLDYSVTIAIRLVGNAVAWLFSPYAELKPTSRLVEGRFISWWEVIQGCLTLGLAMLVVGFFGYMIFRKRELATYSGH